MPPYEKCIFSIEDLPTPALVYSQKNGRLLCWNKPAQKLLGFTKTDKFSLKQWRMNHSLRLKKRNNQWIDLGIIPHFTKEGKELFARVLEKSTTFQGQAAYINWVNDVTDYIKT